MALVNDTIMEVNGYINEIEETYNTILEHIEDSFSKVMGNSDFVTYYTGTQNGQENYKKLAKLISTINLDVKGDVLSLIQSSREYLDEHMAKNNS